MAETKPRARTQTAAVANVTFQPSRVDALLRAYLKSPAVLEAGEALAAAQEAATKVAKGPKRAQTAAAKTLKDAEDRLAALEADKKLAIRVGGDTDVALAAALDFLALEYFKVCATNSKHCGYKMIHQKYSLIDEYSTPEAWIDIEKTPAWPFIANCDAVRKCHPHEEESDDEDEEVPVVPVKAKKTKKSKAAAAGEEAAEPTAAAAEPVAAAAAEPAAEPAETKAAADLTPEQSLYEQELKTLKGSADKLCKQAAASSVEAEGAETAKKPRCDASFKRTIREAAYTQIRRFAKNAAMVLNNSEEKKTVSSKMVMNYFGMIMNYFGHDPAELEAHITECLEKWSQHKSQSKAELATRQAAREAEEMAKMSEAERVAYEAAKKEKAQKQADEAFEKARARLQQQAEKLKAMKAAADVPAADVPA